MKKKKSVDFSSWLVSAYFGSDDCRHLFRLNLRETCPPTCPAVDHHPPAQHHTVREFIKIETFFFGGGEKKNRKSTCVVVVEISCSYNGFTAIKRKTTHHAGEWNNLSGRISYSHRELVLSFKWTNTNRSSPTRQL